MIAILLYFSCCIHTTLTNMLNTMDEPQFLLHPKDTFFVKQQQQAVNLKCTLKNFQVAYFDCNGKIIDMKNKHLSMLTSNGTQSGESLLANVKRKDVKSKNFTCMCVAISARNQKFISNKAFVKIAYLDDEFQSDPMDEVAFEGETIELRCDTPLGDPQPSVYWLKNGQLIKTNEDASRFKVSNDNSLLILVANIEDAGDYECVAWNLVDKRISRPAHLTILDSRKRYAWSEWSDWGKCSVECGQGNQKRKRHCQSTKYLTQVSNDLCENLPSEETQLCFSTNSCLETINDKKQEFTQHGQWSPWSSWSACSTDCKQYRRRYCVLNENQIVDETHCLTNDKLQVRPCANMTKVCRDRFNAVDPSKEFIHENHSQNHMFSFIIGISFGLLLLAILILSVGFYFKKHKSKHKKYSNTNLYFTCENPKKLIDDTLSTTASSALDTNRLLFQSNTTNLYSPVSTFYAAPHIDFDLHAAENSNFDEIPTNHGISLFAPYGSLTQMDSFHIRLHKLNIKLREKEMCLVPCFTISSLDNILEHPLVVIIEHCLLNIHSKWNIRVYTKHQESLAWSEEDLRGVSCLSDDKIILLNDKISLPTIVTAEPKCPLVEKSMRLVAFYSTSMTSDDLSLRIYCVDNRKQVLVDILKDEQEINGELIEISECFTIESNLSDSIGIVLDVNEDSLYTTRCWSIKHNNNYQEIPLSHLWCNHTNNLLHCSFIIERNEAYTHTNEDKFELKLNAFQVLTQRSLVNMNLSPKK